MTPYPTTPGYYWYKGRTPTGGWILEWKIVEVYRTADGALLVDDHLSVDVGEPSQWFGDCVGPLLPPADGWQGQADTPQA